MPARCDNERLVETVAFVAGVEATPVALADEVEVLVTFGAAAGVDVDANRATGRAVVALVETGAFVAGAEATPVALAGEFEVLVTLGAAAGVDVDTLVAALMVQEGNRPQPLTCPFVGRSG